MRVSRSIPIGAVVMAAAMITALIGAPAALAEDAPTPDATTQSVVLTDTNPSPDVTPVEEPTDQQPVADVVDTNAPVVNVVDAPVPSDLPATDPALTSKPVSPSVVEMSSKTQTAKKVFVCKYVGTPGADERLKAGKNPISVSVNAIQNNQWDGTVPGYFSDAHDRSYVLAYDTGQAAPDVSECPAADVPPVVKKQEVGVYIYPLLDTSEAPSWENSGLQIFCQSKDGTDWFTSINCTLPPEVCGVGWGYQQDKVKDWAYDGAFKWPANIQYPVDNIGWPPIYDAQHGLLSSLTTVPPCAPPPPPTATQCTATNSYLVTNANEQGFNYVPTGTPYADTRPGATYEYVDGALHVVTTTGASKLQASRAVDIPLAQYGGTFAMNFTFTTGTIEPGINVVIDADNDGTNDVTLTAEPNVAGYLTFWTNTPGYLPATLGGQGGPYAGTQNDLLAVWPDAHVKVEKLSLGSGVVTDGKVISWSTPCNTYTYDYVAPPVVVAPSATITSVCSVDGGSDVSIVLAAGTYDFTFQILVNGDQVGEQLVRAGETFTYETTLAEDSGGGSATVQVKSGGTNVTDVITVSTDCLAPVVPVAPVATVQSACVTDGTMITATAKAGTSDTTFQFLVSGDLVEEKTVLAGEEYVFTTTVAEDFDSGSTVVEVTSSEVTLTGEVTVSTDCKVPPKNEPPKTTTPSGGVMTDLSNGGPAAMISQLTLEAFIAFGLLVITGAGTAGFVLWRRRKSTMSPTA